MSKNKFLLISSTFTIYLFNSFSFSLLSSPQPYYDFFFHLFVNCKLSLVNSLSPNFIFPRIVRPLIALLATGNTSLIIFVY